MKKMEVNLVWPEPWPSGNKIKGMHWAVEKNIKNAILIEFQQQLHGTVYTPMHDVELIAIRYSTGKLDGIDNLPFGLKFLMDCLTLPTKAKNYGLGLIVDDSPDIITARDVSQIKIPRGGKHLARSELTLFGVME